MFFVFSKGFSILHTVDPYFRKSRTLNDIIINVINVCCASRSSSALFIPYFNLKFTSCVKLSRKYDVVNSSIFQDLVFIQSIYETTGFKKNKMNLKTAFIFIYGEKIQKIIYIMISLKTR